MTPSPPEGAPNVPVVLIDDAGFGNPSTFGGPVSTPAMTRVADQVHLCNHFHVVALCSPTRAALLTGRNHHTVGFFGSLGELPGPFPGYSGERAEGLRSVRPRAPGQRLHDGWVRQVAPDPRSRPGCSRAVRPLAERVGIDHFWGILGGEAGQYDPLITQDNHNNRGPGGLRTARTTTGRTTSPIRRCAGCTRCAPRTRKSHGSSTTRPGARTRRTRSRSSGAKSTAASSTRAGTCSVKRPSNGRRCWA